jgi:hypothetical protein
VREVLVADAAAGLGVRQQHERGVERVAGRGERHVVEVGEGDDQPDVVLRDELRQPRDVARIADARHEGVSVGVVERGRERVEVGCDGRGAGAPEGFDDVHALPGAGEEDGGHGDGG